MENEKTLGPSSAQLLLRLSEQGKNIFSIEDGQEITQQSYNATTFLLGELVRKRWLVRLVPGRYLIVPLEAGLEGIPMADRYVIAREVLGSAEYYISHYSAMQLHQMTTQPVNTVYVTVPRQKRSRMIAGVEYRFVQASRRYFWGWESIWATPQERVHVSDLEKTLLDCVVRPQLCGGVGELGKGLWLVKDELNESRLVAYAERLGHKAAARRIGFLLQTYELAASDTLAALRSYGRRGFDPLDPTLPEQGAHNADWRLRINLDPEELKATVWT